MPLPKPQRDESWKDFVRRRMDDDEKREFPEANPRLAICQKQTDLPAAG